MGKSIRSKVKKRFRTLKRQYYDQVIGNEKLNKLSESLQTNPGHHDKKDITPKNAFLYPNDPDAVFPKFERGIPLDFRNANIDSSGYEFRGSSRKSQAKGAAVETTNIEGLDIELEEIPEANQQAEDDMIDIDEDDLLTDFGTMGIGGATKKIKKNKFNRMDTEGRGDFIPLKDSKRSQAKARSGCKKSKKIMKW